MSQYFINDPKVKDRPRSISFEILGKAFHFASNDGVFSKSSLDEGSAILIKTLLQTRKISGNVLDLGCGYGPIGIILAAFHEEAKFLLVDINTRACALARENARAMNLSNVEVRVSNSFSGVKETFQNIVTNPPIRAGKKVMYAMFQSAYEHLTFNGSFYFVIRKNQGAETASNYVRSVFGNCTRIERSKGYHVYEAKKDIRFANQETKEDLE